MSDFFNFSAENLQGQPVPLAQYRGQWVLVVNTASRCGFTPQYAGLEALHQAYSGKGLVVLGFPCNQFGAQEPGSSEDIGNFCQVNYGVSFPMFAKVAVNGAEAHPLFRWLCAQLPGWLGRPIRWNFTKFLIDPEGTPVKRFAPWMRPDRVAAWLQRQGVV
jgi:glutathione peroxidase